MDEIELRKKRNQREWKKFSAWRKGYKAGKKKLPKEDNPYTLSPDEWELLQKRARWFLGWEEATYTPSRKRLKKEKEAAEQNHKRKDKRKRKHDKSRHHSHKSK